MFKLDVSPTFETSVDIPIPGGGAERVLFIFRHRTRSAFDSLMKALAQSEISVDDVVKDIVVEWRDPNLPYSEEALAKCLDLFPGSAGAILAAYRIALVDGRRKN